MESTALVEGRPAMPDSYRAQDVLESVFASEIELEIDFDDDAMHQLYYCKNRLVGAMFRRDLRQSTTSALTQSFHLRESARKRGKHARDREEELSHWIAQCEQAIASLEGPKKSLEEIVKELQATTTDLSCCKIARSFRVEAESLNVEGLLHEHRVTFVAGLLLLRRLLPLLRNRKRQGRVVDSKYLMNIEKRSVWLEELYTKSFGQDFSEYLTSCDTMVEFPPDLPESPDVETRMEMISEGMQELDAMMADILESRRRVGTSIENSNPEDARTPELTWRAEQRELSSILKQLGLDE